MHFVFAFAFFAALASATLIESVSVNKIITNSSLLGTNIIVNDSIATKTILNETLSGKTEVETVPEASKENKENETEADGFVVDAGSPLSQLKLISQSQPYPTYSPPVETSQSLIDFKLLNKQFDRAKAISGIVLTFSSGFSYDQLFQRIQQESREGTQVLVYSAKSTSIEPILQAFQGNFVNANALLRQLVGQVEVLGKECPNCIVFNWQCSSNYGYNFNEGKNFVFSFLKLILSKGYMAMFSDFSLKSLIHEWDSEVLGPNPFVQTGGTSQPIDLRFNADKLKSSPSSQLQAVGELAENGKVQVRTLGNTIVYVVDSSKLPAKEYHLEVLTVASNFKAKNDSYKSTIDRIEGTAGHVLLTYKSGGHILTSMGHWIQLFKIETSESKVFETIENRLGKSALIEATAAYSAIPKQQQQVYLQSLAQKVVYNQSPGSNSAISANIISKQAN